MKRLSIWLHSLPMWFGFALRICVRHSSNAHGYALPVAEEGRDPDSVAVLVDLEILIAPEARSARKELAQLDSALTSPRVPVSLHYVGTPSGLGSLIADIRAAEVADGVTLLPLALPRTLEHLVDSTIPWLQDRGLVTPSTAVDEVLGRFGLPPRQRTLAS